MSVVFFTAPLELVAGRIVKDEQVGGALWQVAENVWGRKDEQCRLELLGAQSTGDSSNVVISLVLDLLLLGSEPTGSELAEDAKDTSDGRVGIGNRGELTGHLKVERRGGRVKRLGWIEREQIREHASGVGRSHRSARDGVGGGL